MSYRKELLKGGAIGGIVAGIGQVGNILLRFTISRFFGAAGIGLFEVGMSIIRISSSIAEGGISQIMVKYIAQERNLSLKYQYVRGGLIAIISLALMLAIILLNFKNFFVATILQTDSVLIFYVVILAIPLWSISQYYAFCLRGFKKVAKSVSLQSAAFPYLLLLAITVSYFLEPRMEFVFLSLIPCLFIMTLMGSLFLKIKTSITTMKIKPFFQRLFSDSIMVWFVSIARILSLRMDKLVLTLFVSTELVGIYSIGFLMASVLEFVPSLLSPISQPLLAKYLKESNLAEKLYKDLMFYSAVLMLPMFLFLVFNGVHILTFFGKDFTESYTVFLIIGIGIFLNGFVGPTGDFMIMGGHQKMLAIIQYISLISTMILFLILIPEFGIIGAALSRSFTWICAEISKLIYINRKTGLSFLSIQQSIRLCIIAAVLVILGLLSHFFLDNVIAVLSFILGAIVLYWFSFKSEIEMIKEFLVARIRN